jgi:hypothetical protein
MVSKLGVAQFGVIPSDMSYSVIEMEKKFGISIPKIFACPLHSGLADTVKAPLFNRLAITASEYSNSFIRFMKFFKWTRATWVVTEIPDFVDLLLHFEEFG